MDIVAAVAPALFVASVSISFSWFFLVFIFRVRRMPIESIGLRLSRFCLRVGRTIVQLHLSNDSASSRGLQQNMLPAHCSGYYLSKQGAPIVTLYIQYIIHSFRVRISVCSGAHSFYIIIIYKLLYYYNEIKMIIKTF